MSVTEEIQATAFAEGTRTGEWFAIGDATQDPLLHPSSPDVRGGSNMRRNIVRAIGCFLIGGTIACVVRLATHAPARQAILRWGLFGQSERVLSVGHR